MCLFIKIEWKHGSRGQNAKEYKYKEKKYITPTRGKSFLWMEAVFEDEFCNLQIYSSFSMLLNSIQN